MLQNLDVTSGSKWELQNFNEHVKAALNMQEVSTPWPGLEIPGLYQNLNYLWQRKIILNWDKFKTSVNFLLLILSSVLSILFYKKEIHLDRADLNENHLCGLWRMNVWGRKCFSALHCHLRAKECLVQTGSLSLAPAH